MQWVYEQKNIRWDVSVAELLNKTLTGVVVDMQENTITFSCDDGTKYVMYHEQDCCEDVTIEDICGDINWLVGMPIIVAEEISNVNEPSKDGADSYTWTFYKIGTNNGVVTIRWYGSSNGYYSETVDFIEVID